MHPLYIVLISVASAILLLVLVYLILAAPSRKRREEMLRFTRVDYAHRGLHNAERPENSLAAFRAAVEAGYGIELDVQLSADGELVVFHDSTLNRVTEGEGKVLSKTLAELKQLHLNGTDERIPTFCEALKLIDGRVPLLVEIKEDPMKYGVTEKTAEILRGYKGEFIVESFNPFAIRRFKKLMPGVLRGVLSDYFTKKKELRSPLYWGVQMFCANAFAEPDFIAFNHLNTDAPGLRIQKSIFRPVLIAWTIKSKEEDIRAREFGFDAIIFDNYTD